MNRQTIILKAQLRVMGVDDRVDFRLDNAVKKEPAAFTLPYRKDVGKDILICDLHFKRNGNKPEYQLDHYEASLLQRIHIPDLFYEGVGLAQLCEQLKAAAAEVAPDNLAVKKGGEQRPHVTGLNTLRATQHGSRLADLLVARYLPQEATVDRFGFRLGYDTSLDRFSLTRPFAAKEKTNLDQCYEMLSTVMAYKIPKFSLLAISPARAEREVAANNYSISATVIDVKTGQKKVIKSTHTFGDPAIPVKLMTALDPQLFDWQFVKAHASHLKACLRTVSIYEAGRKVPLLSIGNTMAKWSQGLRLELTMTHPTLGPISFGQQVMKIPGAKDEAADMAKLVQQLADLGLAGERKKISTKVIPAASLSRKVPKRRGGRHMG